MAMSIFVLHPGLCPELLIARFKYVDTEQIVNNKKTTTTPLSLSSSISLFLSTYLSIYLPLSLSIEISIYLSFYQFLYLPLYLFNRLFPLFLTLSFFHLLSLSLSFSLSHFLTQPSEIMGRLKLTCLMVLIEINR